LSRLQGALPEAYVEYVSGLLPANKTDAFIKSCGTRLRPSIRVNTLKGSVGEFISRHRRGDARNAEWDFKPIPWCPEGLWISPSSNGSDLSDLQLGSRLEHLAGLYYVQEASSMLPVTALLDGGDLDTRDSDLKILDMAAAPGSKTTQLAARLANRGLVCANELSASRLKGLFSNVQRTGTTNTILTQADGRDFPHHEGSAALFDAVLLDAPCSGEGTVRKNPKEELPSWSLRSVLRLQSLQKGLIDAAMGMLREGGVLVYSTCTLNHYENEEVVRWLLEESGHVGRVEVVRLDGLCGGSLRRSATDEGFLHVWPHHFDCEGFFVAKLRKKAGGHSAFAAAAPLSLVGSLTAQQVARESLSAPAAATALRDREPRRRTQRMVRSELSSPPSFHRWLDRFEPPSTEEARQLHSFFTSRYGFGKVAEWHEEGRLRIRRARTREGRQQGAKRGNGGAQQQPRVDEWWLLPTGAASFLNSIGGASRVKVSRVGVKIAERPIAAVKRRKEGVADGGVRPTHEMVMAFGGEFSGGAVDVSDEEARLFCRGHDLPLTHGDSGACLTDRCDIVVRWAGLPLGVGRVQMERGRLKNMLPRDVVRDTVV